MVPRFTSLAAFIRYKRWFTDLPAFVPGPERHDLAGASPHLGFEIEDPDSLEARMRRHPNINPVSPYSRLPLSARRHEAQKAHISFTSARH